MTTNASHDRPRLYRVSRSAVILLIVIVGLFAVSGWLQSRLATTQPAATTPRHCHRIVSLAPSVTETLFALGLHDRIVGVSRYCEFPPEATHLPRVGGFFDPNIEAIIALDPDLVIFPTPGAAAQRSIEKLGLPTLVLDHRTPQGLFDSFTAIGQACDVQSEAAALAERLQTRLRRVTKKTAGLPRRRVMLVMDHSQTDGQITDAYVAGNSPSFNPFIRWAGGENVFADAIEASPVVSREAILKANPEVIVDLASLANVQGQDGQAFIDQWKHLAQVDAVEHGQVYVITDNYARVPGPRFILLVEQLARLFHPEADWKD